MKHFGSTSGFVLERSEALRARLRRALRRHRKAMVMAAIYTYFVFSFWAMWHFAWLIAF